MIKMLRKNSTIIMAAATLIVMVAFYVNNGTAQNRNFAHIEVIDGHFGTVRFFDKLTGRIYTYDNTMQKVLRIVQLNELGMPAEIIEDEKSDGESRYSNPRDAKK